MDRFTFYADSIAASMHDVVYYYIDEESKEGGGDWTSFLYIDVVCHEIW